MLSFCHGIDNLNDYILNRLTKLHDKPNYLVILIIDYPIPIYRVINVVISQLGLDSEHKLQRQMLRLHGVIS